jgi:hypothetical protein
VPLQKTADSEGCSHGRWQTAPGCYKDEAGCVDLRFSWRWRCQCCLLGCNAVSILGVEDPKDKHQQVRCVVCNALHRRSLALDKKQLQSRTAFVVFGLFSSAAVMTVLWNPLKIKRMMYSLQPLGSAVWRLHNMWCFSRGLWSPDGWADVGQTAG